MAQVVTVMNMKGGVGKTTVSAHIGGALSIIKPAPPRTPRKVLLVDYDPQFNLSQSYIPAAQYFALDKQKKTVISVLQDSGADLNPFVLQLPTTAVPPKVSELAHPLMTYKDGRSLSIVPSTLDLMYVALGQTQGQVEIIERRFRSFMDEAREYYDLVLIDCHPAGSLLTKTALSNSDHVVIPVTPERYGVRGVGLMFEFVQSFGGNKPAAHVLFNRTARAGVSQEENSIRANPRYSKYCLTNTLKKYSAFADLEEGKGLVWRSSKPYSTEAWWNLSSVADELATRIGV